MIAVVALSACSILQEPEEASGPIEAVPLEVESQEVPDESEASEQTEEEPPMEEAEEAADESAETELPAQGEGGGLVIFQITPDGSEVRFELDEELRGQPKTVVGATDQVAGEIAVDFSDLSTAQAGILQINARTLTTDNDFRNRALNNQILETGSFEFITFTPTSVVGLPNSVSVGEMVSFSIVGDLTIRDVTNEATFTVEATPVSETQITGSANTTVTRGDYGLQIPSVPNVANVEDEVELYIDFTANAS